MAKKSNVDWLGLEEAIRSILSGISKSPNEDTVQEKLHEIDETIAYYTGRGTSMGDKLSLVSDDRLEMIRNRVWK